METSSWQDKPQIAFPGTMGGGIYTSGGRGGKAIKVTNSINQNNRPDENPSCNQSH
jgi:hypothetical protein